jgi:protein DGCR14
MGTRSYLVRDQGQSYQLDHVSVNRACTSNKSLTYAFPFSTAPLADSPQEDTYTDALSHIITRDFFPNLPQIHATNAYLTALTNNDPELLSASIRRLAALAQDKEDGKGSIKGKEAHQAQTARRRELENVGTPYISMPGARRTPVGARGWDTPADVTSRREDDYDEPEDDAAPGPSRPRKKRNVSTVRDDLSLDAFQRNYTSEDNASFVQIVDEENKRRREERWGWAWDVEKRAEERRIEGEERRKLILDAATSGNWRVNAEGRRLIGGLAEGGKGRNEGEAWKEERKLIAVPSGDSSSSPSASEAFSSSALVKAADTSSALIRAGDAAASLSHVESFREEALPADHPLGRALTEFGLPATALVSEEDGALIPHREATAGGGEGRGRGADEKDRRTRIELAVMGDEEREHFALGGSGADHWGYKVCTWR